MSKTTYTRKWAKKTDASVEVVKYAGYDRRLPDGKTEPVLPSERLSYFAEDGNVFSVAGETPTRVVYFVPETVEEVEEE